MKAGAVRFSERWASMLGLRLEQLSPTRETWDTLIHPEDREACREALRRHVDGELPYYESVHRMRHADGRWVDILDRGKVFERDEEGIPVRICGTHTDISSEKAAERAATESNRAKTHFLANMSHELRTPLNAVLGLSDALLEGVYGRPTEDQCHALRTIHDSGRHLLALINDVLDIARVEAGKLPVAPRPAALRPVITECIAFVKGQADTKRQRIVVQLEDAVDVVVADPRRLRQIVLNLLTNALKFSPERSTVTIGVGHQDGGDGVELWVSDRGKGIAPEDHARIFEPFVTLNDSLKREERGAGLGLALVKRLVELHGGSVRVDSAPGRGATFTVSLRATTAPTDASVG